VADARKIHEVLGWQPRNDDLDKIVRSAYAWEQRLNAAG
jgi:UDP-glucose 4-epimerase